MNQNHIKTSLSVAISCKGNQSILIQNLKALHQQNLNKDLWKLILLIFETEFQKIISVDELKLFPDYSCITLPNIKPIYELKNEALKQITSQLIYFIDEDVILHQKNQLSHIIQLHHQLSDAVVIGGNYISHPNSSLWGQSYNWISSLWGEAHSHYMPAGNLSIKNRLPKDSRFYSPHPKGFGGEEIYFLDHLLSKNYKIKQIKSLDTFHLATHSFKDFCLRAMYHSNTLSYQKNRLDIFQSIKCFWTHDGTVLIKVISLFYILIVQILSLFYSLKIRK